MVDAPDAPATEADAAVPFILDGERIVGYTRGSPHSPAGVIVEDRLQRRQILTGDGKRAPYSVAVRPAERPRQRIADGVDKGPLDY